MSAIARDHHNQRRRKVDRLVSKALAFGVYVPKLRSWRKPVTPRCEARTKVGGHRCRRDPHTTGNHQAFGRDWK